MSEHWQGAQVLSRDGEVCRTAWDSPGTSEEQAQRSPALSEPPEIDLEPLANCYITLRMLKGLDLGHPIQKMPFLFSGDSPRTWNV